MTRYSLYLSAIQDDLRALVDAQEAFFGEHVSYAQTLDKLTFAPSPGVQISLRGISEGAWSATATHSGLPSIRCSIAVGA